VFFWRVVRGKGAQQVPPLRYAPVGMTNLIWFGILSFVSGFQVPLRLANAVASELEMESVHKFQPTKQILDLSSRSEAQWRDLRFTPPQTNPHRSDRLRFVIPTEAKRSGGTCCAPFSHSPNFIKALHSQICHPERREGSAVRLSEYRNLMQVTALPLTSGRKHSAGDVGAS